MDNFHKMIVMGLGGVAALSVLLFNFEWTVVLGLQEDVTVIRESVARIEGRIDSYWPLQNLTKP